MKQVGLGRGCIRLPVSSDQQPAVGGPRLATTSSAFSVDALVGCPNIVTGGSEQSFPRLQSAASQSGNVVNRPRPVSSSTLSSGSQSGGNVVNWPRPASTGNLLAVSAGSDDVLENGAGLVDDMKREERKLRKRLKEILKLQEAAVNGKQLNEDQLKKVTSRGEVEWRLRELSGRDGTLES